MCIIHLTIYCILKILKSNVPYQNYSTLKFITVIEVKLERVGLFLYTVVHKVFQNMFDVMHFKLISYK